MPCYSLRYKRSTESYRPSWPGQDPGRNKDGQESRRDLRTPPPYEIAVGQKGLTTVRSCSYLQDGQKHWSLGPSFWANPFPPRTGLFLNCYPKKKEKTPQSTLSHASTQGGRISSASMHPQEDNRVSTATKTREDLLLILGGDEPPAKPRSPYLTASDYVFYIRRQLARERGFEGDPPEDKTMMVELPKLTDLLRRLRDDLRVSFASFVEDFVGEPNEGVTWLLDLLKACQNRKTRSDGKMSVRNKERHQIMKRTLADEFECLLCLRFSTRSLKAVDKMVNHRNGMSTVATCIMSDFTKSRMLALQLLTKVCEISPVGFQKTLEAMSSLRLIYGESVRFKFLIAILNGNASTPQGFEYVALGFLNTILSCCPRPSERIRLQCELEEAGFQIALLEGKLRDKEISKEDQAWGEVKFWKERYLDVGALLEERKKTLIENAKMKEELETLRKTSKKLEMDKINLMQIERDLKDRCVDLEQEMGRLTTSDSKPRIIAANPKPKQDVKKTPLHSEDSDSSDPHATDSGRCSFMTDDSCSPAEETDQPESEEIFIDIPTICPPAGFRSTAAAFGDPIMSENDRYTQATTLQRKSTGHKSLKNSSVNLSRSTPTNEPPEIETKGIIEWEYPIIPKISSTAAILKRSRSEDKSRSSKKSLRTRSEERNNKSQQNSSVAEDVKYAEASGFFYKTRARKPLSELFPDTFKKSTPRADWNTNSLPAVSSPTQHNSKSQIQQQQQPSSSQASESSKYFPLPPSYRNNFILRGHSNCDMFSGGATGGTIDTSPFQKNGPSRDSMRKLQPLENKDSADLNKPNFVKNGNGRKSEATRSSRSKMGEQNGTNPLGAATPGRPSALDVSPHGTISALVHKEIAEAVRQISGWL